MLADMLSKYYSKENGFLEQFDYLKYFEFDDSNDTFALTFDKGEEPNIVPTWILTDAEHSIFDEFYVELNSIELIKLHELLTKAVNALQEYEANKL